MLRYLLLLLTSFLGLHMGTIMAHFTKQEIMPGKRYFLILKPIVFSLVILYFFIYLKLNYYLAAFLTIGFFSLGYLMMKKVKHDFIFYTIFSIIIFETRDFSYVPGILIFLYGLIASALRFDGFWKTIKKLTIENITYLLFGIIISL